VTGIVMIFLPKVWFFTNKNSVLVCIHRENTPDDGRFYGMERTHRLSAGVCTSLRLTKFGKGFAFLFSPDLRLFVAYYGDTAIMTTLSGLLDISKFFALATFRAVYVTKQAFTCRFVRVNEIRVQSFALSINFHYQ